MLTDFEKEILSSETKRKSISKQTVLNTTQKVRDKATQAIEDLIFLGDNAPLQLAQALGYTRSGRLWSKKEFKTYRPGKPRRQIEQVTSKTLLKRLKRLENAKRLAMNLAVNTDVIDEWRNQNELKVKETNKPGIIVDLHACNAAFPRFLAGMLKNQFVCPKCGNAGVLFRNEEEWLFMHFNQDNQNPKADFCNIGEKLPKDIIMSPFIVIEPKTYTCWTNLAAVGPDDTVKVYT